VVAILGAGSAGVPAYASGVATPAASCTPTITTVGPILATQNQTVQIEGSCFGNGNAFSSADNNYFAITDTTAQPVWQGCWQLQPIGANHVTCTVPSWSDNSITFAGFTGEYGTFNWVLIPGDVLQISVWNAQTGAGPASCFVTVGAGKTSCSLPPVGTAPGPTFCSRSNGSELLSPGLPQLGDSTTVVPTVTGTVTIGGCVGMGVTSGRESFTGTASNPDNCSMLALGNSDPIAATGLITWNTGQTSTLAVTDTLQAPKSTITGTITAGLFTGASISETFVDSFPNGACAAGGTTATTVGLTLFDAFVVSLPGSASATCTTAQTCASSVSAAATAAAPGLTVTVSGRPAAGSGTVQLAIAPATLRCPHAPATLGPVTTLGKTGFTAADQLTVTAILALTSTTSTAQVCFSSTVPFRSQSSPTVAKPGTAFLLSCAKDASTPPCVRSSKQVGTDIVTTFVVPGNDPRFAILMPTGRHVWLSRFPIGRVGAPYAARLQSSGGIAPIHWTVAAGKLPGGIRLNSSTGAITGKPTARGASTFVAQATDAERPAKTAKMTVTITVN
jgi:hypothetical protein